MKQRKISVEDNKWEVKHERKRRKPQTNSHPAQLFVFFLQQPISISMLYIDVPPLRLSYCATMIASFALVLPTLFFPSFSILFHFSICAQSNFKWNFSSYFHQVMRSLAINCNQSYIFALLVLSLEANLLGVMARV